MDKEIKVLIISNNALELSNSNGRTMCNMLGRFSAENIASFHISGNNDFNICKYCFKVTDNEAVLAFFNKKKYIKILKSKKISSQNNNMNLTEPIHKKIVNNCRNKIIRDIIWKSNRWWTKEFDDFLVQFNPNALIFQAGDSPFMYQISMKIAKKLDLPLIVFNTENYVLKKQLYSSIDRQVFWHFILKNRLKSAYFKISKLADYFIYSSEYLQDEFSKTYPCRSIVIYGSTDMSPIQERKHEGFVISYIGNLGVGRHIPLIEIAKTISEMNDNIKLNIFGKFTSDEIKESVCAFDTVNYCGVIPYKQVREEMSKSDMILHCEARDRLEDLSGAFSTKIADSLASGIPLLVYADRGYPFVQYLEKWNAAFVAENKDELRNILNKCIYDDTYRRKNVAKAYELSQRNHNKAINSYKMYEILKEVINKHKFVI